MSEIKLKRIAITNFRGLKRFEADLGPSRTVICGDNATGKSTIFAAFTWALFGKDEKDRKDYEIKPCKDGNPQRMETSVTLVLSVDGNDMSLCREYREKWVKHKGEAQETYEGNETTCFWDGAPVSVTEYGRRVSEIVGTEMFKVLTNPAFFATMKWQDQRRMLADIAGEPSDTELVKGDEAMEEFLKELSGKSLSDFKAEVNRALKTLKKKAEEIQPRIEEVAYNAPTPKGDRKKIEAECEAARKELEGVDAQLQSESGRQKAIAQKLAEMRQELDRRKAKAYELSSGAVREENERVRKANASRQVLADDISRLERKIEADANYIKSFASQTDSLTREYEEMLKEHKEMCELYTQQAAASFPESGAYCPTCGNPLTQEQLEKAWGQFNEEKAVVVDGIVKRGQKLKERVERRRAELNERSAKVKGLIDANIAEQKALERMRAQYAASVEEKAAEIDPYTVPGYAEAMRQASEIEAEMTEFERQSDSGAAQALDEALAARKKLVATIDEKRGAIADFEAHERANARISELEEEGRELGQQIAMQECRIFQAERLEHARTQDLEGRVNGMFHSVKWRLFDRTLEGNAVETCVAVVGDALYPVANSAAKLNAGLDIIHTLSQKLGTSCPIFIDNAEGVTSIQSYGLQVIELRVEKGSKLEVTLTE